MNMVIISSQTTQIPTTTTAQVIKENTESKSNNFLITNTRLLACIPKCEDVTKILIANKAVDCYQKNLEIIFSMPIKGVPQDVSGFLTESKDRTIAFKQETSETCKKIRK